MKINWNKKYNTYAAYACAVGAAIILFIFLGVYFTNVLAFLRRIIDVFAPLIYGVAIAYVLNPLCRLFEKKVFVGIGGPDTDIQQEGATEKEKKKKVRLRNIKRAISMVLSYSIFFAVLALMVYAVVPELTRSFNDLQNNLIIYANSLQEWLDSISASSPQFGAIIKTIMDTIDINSISESITQLFSSLSDILTALAPVIRDFAEVLGIQVKNILLGLVFSVYFLASKELVAAQIRKLAHALLSEEKYKKMSHFIRFTDHTFGRYLMGTFLDSLFVGIEFFVVLSIFRFPYAPLVSIVCGFTNMIPIFGPFIGAIPSFLIIFIAEPAKAFWFVLIVLVIQQIDGNIIAPRILGESTGLSAIAVISAVTIMGGLFGIPGMVIGVPLCAVFAKLVTEKTEEKRLAKETAKAIEEAQARAAVLNNETAPPPKAAEKNAETTVASSAVKVEGEDSKKAATATKTASAKPQETAKSAPKDADAELPASEKAKKMMSQILSNCMKPNGKGGKKR